MSELIVDRVTAFAEKLLPTMGLELVEVQFRREQQGWTLRVYIDGESGITHEFCGMVSRELGDYLEVEELIDHAYHLEVSSPGLERKLYKINDFKRFSGRKAKVKLRQAVDNQKVFIGEITNVDGEMIELAIENEEKISFSFDNVSNARLSI